MGERYVVQKVSGSHLAYVYDTKTMRSVARYNILKGQGKRNGWTMAEAHARRLNANSPQPPQKGRTDE